MIRGIIRCFINLFSCRLKLTSKSMVIGMIMFIGGNYIILRSMFYGNNNSNTSDIISDGINNGGSQLLNNDKSNRLNNEIDDNRQDFIENTFDKGRNNIIRTKLSPHIKSVLATEEPPAMFVNKEDSDTGRANREHGEKIFKIALLVISCNRVEVRRCLDKIFQYKPKGYPIQVVVSQDCGHEQTSQVIRSYGDKLKFVQQPDLGPVRGVPNNMHRFMGYYKISRHFKFALGQVFETTDSDSVIIVEDDIDIGMKYNLLSFGNHKLSYKLLI